MSDLNGIGWIAFGRGRAPGAIGSAGALLRPLRTVPVGCGVPTHADDVQVAIDPVRGAIPVWKQSDATTVRVSANVLYSRNLYLPRGAL